MLCVDTIYEAGTILTILCKHNCKTRNGVFYRDCSWNTAP